MFQLESLKNYIAHSNKYKRVEMIHEKLFILNDRGAYFIVSLLNPSACQLFIWHSNNFVAPPGIKHKVRCGTMRETQQ